MKKISWKRFLVLALAAFLVIGILAGCGSKSVEPKSTQADSTTTVSTEQSMQKVTTPSDTAKKTEDIQGKIVMWGWDENPTKAAAPEFNKLFPNVQIEFVNVKEFLKKVQTSVAAGMELPDILWQNLDERGALYQLNILEDLSKEPYNLDKASIFDFGLSVTTDENGQIVGIPWDMAIGGLAYKRELAKQYFGTDDPDALNAIFTDWNVFISKGEEVAKKSGGKVFMLPGLDDWYYIGMGQVQKPVSNGNIINFDEAVKPVIELGVKMRDAGVVDKLKQWSPAWNASFSIDEHIFYPCPMWGPKFMFKANDKDSKGRWGIMVPPGGGFNWAGTAMGITKGSKNKEASWKFIQWYLISKEGAELNKKSNEYFIHYKPAYDDPNFKSNVDPYFGGQDIGEMFFDKIAPTVKLKPVSKYDNSIADSCKLVLGAVSTDKKLNLDGAIKYAKDEIKNKAGDAEIK